MNEFERYQREILRQMMEDKARRMREAFDKEPSRPYDHYGHKQSGPSWTKNPYGQGKTAWVNKSKLEAWLEENEPKSFTKHLETCKRCNDEPFNLCPEGAGILKDCKKRTAVA
jgi:hypothetical protein